MALDFNGTTERLKGDSGALSWIAGLQNFTIHLVFKLPSIATYKMIMAVRGEDGSSRSRGFFIQMNSSQYPRALIWYSTDNWSSGVSADIVGDATLSTNTWYAVTFQVDLTGTTKFWVNGVQQTSTIDTSAGSTYQDPANYTTVGDGLLRLGGYAHNIANDYSDTDIGEFAMWGRTLSDGECAAIGKGMSPAALQNGLKIYVPGLNGSYNDLKKQVTFTGDTNTPAAAAHPPVRYPSHQILQPPKKGKIWVNDSPRWDEGALEQKHPGKKRTYAGLSFREHGNTGSIVEPTTDTHCSEYYNGGQNDPYPTHRNGLTFGWGNYNQAQTRDRTGGSYARTRGVHFPSTPYTSERYIRIDLPRGAGTYRIYAALGDRAFDHPSGQLYFEFWDGETEFLTLDTSTSAPDYFRDINNNPLTEAEWNAGSTYYEHTFTSSYLKIQMTDYHSGATGKYGHIAHLGLEWDAEGDWSDTVVSVGQAIRISRDWPRRAPLVIQASQVSADLTNFPVLLTKDTLPAECIDAGEYSAQSGGADLRFSLDPWGAQPIPHEVVSFVPHATAGSRSAEIWVKVPSVSSLENTVIYVWYGNPNASALAVTDPNGRNAVWADYDHVYHLQEASGTLVDSTGNGDLTAVGTIAYSQTGQIGSGIDNDTTADYLENTLSSATSGYGAGDFSISMWVSADASSQPAWGGMASYGGSTSNVWAIQRNGASADLRVYVQNGASYFTWDHTDFFNSVFGAGLTHFVYVNDFDTSGTAYLDGTSYNSDTTKSSGSDSVESSPTLKIGAERAGISIAGIYDEVRCRGSVLTTDWIAAEYANQNSPSTFVVEGTPESTDLTSTLEFVNNEMVGWAGKNVGSSIGGPSVLRPAAHRYGTLGVILLGQDSSPISPGSGADEWDKLMVEGVADEDLHIESIDIYDGSHSGAVGWWVEDKTSPLAETMVNLGGFKDNIASNPGQNEAETVFRLAFNNFNCLQPIAETSKTYGSGTTVTFPATSSIAEVGDIVIRFVSIYRRSTTAATVSGYSGTEIGYEAGANYGVTLWCGLETGSGTTVGTTTVTLSLSKAWIAYTIIVKQDGNLYLGVQAANRGRDRIRWQPIKVVTINGITYIIGIEGFSYLANRPGLLE